MLLGKTLNPKALSAMPHLAKLSPVLQALAALQLLPLCPLLQHQLLPAREDAALNPISRGLSLPAVCTESLKSALAAAWAWMRSAITTHT